MSEIKLTEKTLKLTLALAEYVFSAIALAFPGFTQVQAQPVSPVLFVQRSSANTNRQFNQSVVFAAPPPPSDIEAPGRRSEAGSRGCGDLGKQPTFSNKAKRLTALVPVYPDYKPLNSKLVLGATASEHPTFWFYVPYQSPLTGKFVLQDKDENLVYETEIPLPQTPGVISFSLPSTAAPLEIGKQYHWYFKIDCTQPPLFVDGWIQRSSLNPTLQSQLEKATLQERVVLYATNGFWHEALTAASELHRLNPKDTYWAALLQAVGLDDFALEPRVECCESGTGN